MKLPILGLVLFVFLHASIASAEGLLLNGVPLQRALTLPSLASGEVFTTTRSGWNQVAARAVAQQSPQTQRKSFWKSPWPYLIIGAAVAVGVAMAAAGDDKKPVVSDFT